MSSSKTIIASDRSFAHVIIDVLGLSYASVTVRPGSAVAVAQRDNGSNVWVGLAVGDDFFPLVIWKHTVGRPELDAAVKRAAAEVEAAIAALSPTFNAWCLRFGPQDASYNAQTSEAHGDERSAAHWRMVRRRLDELAAQAADAPPTAAAADGIVPEVAAEPAPGGRLVPVAQLPTQQRIDAYLMGADAATPDLRYTLSRSRKAGSTRHDLHAWDGGHHRVVAAISRRDFAEAVAVANDRVAEDRAADGCVRCGDASALTLRLGTGDLIRLCPDCFEQHYQRNERLTLSWEVTRDDRQPAAPAGTPAAAAAVIEARINAAETWDEIEALWPRLVDAEQIARVAGAPAAALSPVSLELGVAVAQAQGEALGLPVAAVASPAPLEPGTPVVVLAHPHSGAAGEVVAGPDAGGFYAVAVRVGRDTESWLLLPDEFRADSRDGGAAREGRRVA